MSDTINPSEVPSFSTGEAPVAGFHMDYDLSGVNTKSPLAAPGQYRFVLVSAKVRPNKANNGNVMELESIAAPGQEIPNQNGDGQSMPANYPFTNYISLTPTFDPADPTKIKYDPRQNVARLAEALFGAPLPAGITPNSILTQGPGTEFIGNVIHRPDQNKEPRAEIGKYIPKIVQN